MKNYVVRYDAISNLYEVGIWIETRFYIVATVKAPSGVAV